MNIVLRPQALHHTRSSVHCDSISCLVFIIDQKCLKFVGGLAEPRRHELPEHSNRTLRTEAVACSTLLEGCAD